MPTRSELAKTNSFQSSQCLACGCAKNFTHLLRCINPTAQKFRDSLMDKLDDYFTHTNTPSRFRQLFITSLQYWLDPIITLPSGDHNVTCFSQQQLIGWDLFPRGFIAKSWSKAYLEAWTPTDSTTRLIPPLQFMAGTIQLLWKAQLEYWQKLMEAQHLSTSHHIYHEKATEYKTRIRLLHDKRDSCLHCHRESYFYDDLDAFLDRATMTQMRAYLHHYESAIHHSIQEAQKLQSRPLFHFPGFSRRVRTLAQQNPSISRRLNHPRPPYSTADRGSTIVRKHTRWRSTAPPWIRSIKDFFSHAPPPN